MEKPGINRYYERLPISKTGSGPPDPKANQCTRIGGCRNMKKNGVKISFFLLIIFAATSVVSTSSVLGKDELTVATMDYTSNWNPVSHRTYPAHFITNLVAERLFERKCYSRMMDEIVFSNGCMKIRSARFHSNALNFDPDHAACPGLTNENMRYTIKDQINNVPYNEYYINHLDFKSGRILIGYPDHVAPGFAMDILSFPIFRGSSSSNRNDFFKKIISVGNEPDLNQITRGRYKVNKITEANLNLTLRNTNDKDKSNRSVDKLKLIYFRYPKNLITLMSHERRPDVVLGLRTKNSINKSLYRYVDSPDLNSFTYIGFNFHVGEPEIRELFFNLDFRELFTHSIWLTSLVQNNTNIGSHTSQNLFIGQSFDPDHVAIVGIPQKEKLKKRIGNFIDNQKLYRKIELEILISPSMKELFEDSDRVDVISQLDDLWSRGDRGVSFFMDESLKGSNEFNEKKQTRAFHMIMDSFHYTRSKLNYMAFIQENNETFNYLGVDRRVIPPMRLGGKDERSITVTECMKRGARGVADFGKLVARHYPVAVIGYFPRRNLISTRVARERDTCGENAIQMPFHDIHKWTLE